MASYSKALNLLTTPRFLAPTTQERTTSSSTFEFEESDIWNSDLTSSSPSSEIRKKKVVPTSHYSSSKRMNESSSGTCSSLPVNVPDWSKIYKKDIREELYAADDDTDYCEDDGEQGGDVRVRDGIKVPPHEYLARQRGASFSVHEGRGRTLKGRDLRQVRNAVWKKIGFED